MLRGLGSPAKEKLMPSWELMAVGQRFDVIVTGVGKANAAAGVARVLDLARHGMVLSIGVGGALKAKSELGIGACVLGSVSVYADEGLPLPDGSFQDIAALGFAPNAGTESVPSIGVEATSSLLTMLRPACDAEGAIATVSECSSTDARAAEVLKRTDADVEAMEGAAIGFAVQRIGGGACGFAEVRVVSNTTGDRSRQQWDIRTSLDRLVRLAARL